MKKKRKKEKLRFPFFPKKRKDAAELFEGLSGGETLFL